MGEIPKEFLDQVLQAREATPEPPKEQSYASEVVELPSRGLFYPPDHPLSKGTIELRPMTAKDEDILTTESYIRKGVVLDKLFQSLIITKGVSYDDILVADRDALMIAARAGAYGEIYSTTVTTPSGKEVSVDIDLTTPKFLEIDETLITPGKNEFTFITPTSKDTIVFKLLTNGDQRAIDEALSKAKKVDQADTQLTTRLAFMIQSINGNADRTRIRLYVRDMLAKDARALRAFIRKVQPGVDLSVELIDEETLEPFRGEVAFGLDFFWPDTKL